MLIHISLIKNYLVAIDPNKSCIKIATRSFCRWRTWIEANGINQSLNDRIYPTKLEQRDWWPLSSTWTLHLKNIFMLLISKNPLIHLIFKQPISNVANGMALLNSFQFFEPKIFIDDGIGTKLLSPFQEFLEYGEAERRGERKNREERIEKRAKNKEVRREKRERRAEGAAAGDIQ